MRVYIPATLTILEQLVADTSLQPRNGTAFAVTAQLRESYTQGDEEELAEVARGQAALASLRLLAGEIGAHLPTDGDDSTPLRRAVVEADIADSDVTARPDLDDAVVRIAGRVGLADVIAIYVDSAAAQPAVAAAIAVVDAADLGDEDAELIVGDAQDYDLGWYATQELPFLLELL